MEALDPLYWLTLYHAPAIFAGAFLFGETIILSAAFLSAQGWWQPGTVFWFSLLGTVIADCVWFFFGHLATRTRRWEKNQEKYARVIEFVERKTGNRPYLALIPIKFMYGTRILTIIYLSLHRVKFWSFLAADLAATALLLAVLIPLGWLAGRGYTNLLTTYHGVTYALGGVLVLFAAYKIVTVWLSRRIIKK
ncbi:MAG: DedA membrane associated protein [Candidatus Magasanikbacteria bacterium GW2011_GWA2_56_11]|uniref:DedA membrane associated protein n=1 Tax=Candidatus Magasanikbacteria bacterium GW2011_GWA2_56_11 TaxID=1619044 RepID=A0A0G2ALM9_9BACT|nr:MAG: DedA membrane associated protein [Candidatus Magasanikbacteria bacterium GW2011_GWA2_56_11]